jgi:hypothetical protein
MSLSSSDQRALSGIETMVCAADPRLASLHSVFARLAAGEAMPGHERLGRPGHRGWLRQLLSPGGRPPAGDSRAGTGAGPGRAPAPGSRPQRPVTQHPGLWPANSPARMAARQGPWPKWTCAGMPGPSRW